MANETVTTSRRGRYSKIPVDTFENLQMRAGMVLTEFDPDTGEYDINDLLCATQGGLTISLTDDTRDNGEDIDNCPKGMAELMEFTDRNATCQMTSVTFSQKFLQFALAAANVSGNKIKPRFNLQMTDFKTLWIVGDKLDGTGIAFCLKRALSTNGVTWQTTDDGKGTMQLTLSGHYTLTNQDDVPYEFYTIAADTSTTYSVTQNLTNVTSSFSGTTIEKDAEFEATLTATTGYTISSVSVKVGGVDVTSSAYNSETHTISIDSVGDNLTITATATED